tara:strand:+ start:206 stop:307 length:102 start_codon:yes stop_codon:yes gene_type:complete
MKELKKYWKMAQDNPKVTAGIIIVAVILLTWIF